MLDLDTRLYRPKITDEDAEKNALEVSRWIGGHSADMVNKSPNQILGYFAQERSMIVQVRRKGKWINAAHAAITKVYSDGSAELGSVITNPELRGIGLSPIVVKELMASDIIEEFPAVFALALLTNIESLGLFNSLTRRGLAERISEPSLPSITREAFGIEINGEKDRPEMYAGYLMRRPQRIAAMEATAIPFHQIAL